MKKIIPFRQSAKKVLAIAAILLITSIASAQTSQTHIVKRGETFASIAAKYGITESELRADNPNAKNCYAGTKLNIVKKAPVQSIAKSSTEASTSGDGGGAVKLMLISAQYNIDKKKYKKATKDINYVLSSTRSTEQQKEEARQLLAVVEDAKEERRERLSEALGNLSNSLKETGNSLMAIGMAASQKDAIQRGGYVSNLPPIPTFNNPPSSNSMGGRYDANWAAEMGKAKAEKILADIKRETRIKEEPYYKGMEYYNAGNYTEAFKWIKQAAEEGITKAKYKLGDMYAEGKGVDKNETIANRWYRQAEEDMRLANEMYIQNQEHINDMMRQSSIPATTNSTTTATQAQKVCTWCNGTGLVLSDYHCRVHGATGCIDIYCQQCGTKHCSSNYSHRTCPSCDGYKVKIR